MVDALCFALKEYAKTQKTIPCGPLRDLFIVARENPEISGAACFSGGTYEKNGSFNDLPQALVELGARYQVEPLTPETLQHRTAEMINVCAWFTAAAQREDKQAKIDFFYMHSVNCSLFLSVFAQSPWLSLDAKARLLEWKVRIDLIIYAGQGTPELREEFIVRYKPRRPLCVGWIDVIERAKAIPCDGHVVKMIRALRHGAEVSAPYENQPNAATAFPIKGDMWTQIANMVLDSAEDYPSILDKWMRGPGWKEAWAKVPDR